MKTVRWGIIGVGDVTEAKSGPAFQQAERSELVAVMRRNGELAADYAARHGVPRWYDDAEALITDPEVDAVYIATPPDSHATYAIRALEAGKPVYVEKPMARTAAECEEMLSASRRTGQTLFVAYYRRAMPRFEKVKELLDGGAIGRVQAFRIENLQPAPIDDGGDEPWRVRPEVAGGGHFVDLGSHTLDLIDHLLGPVTRVHGFAKNTSGTYRAEDLVSATFELSSAVVGTGLWCYAAGEHRDEVEIIGTEGQLTFSSFGQEPLRLRTPAGTEKIDAPYPGTVQQPLIQAVVDALTGHGSSPSTGKSAARTAWVVDALLSRYRREHGIAF